MQNQLLFDTQMKTALMNEISIQPIRLNWLNSQHSVRYVISTLQQCNKTIIEFHSRIIRFLASIISLSLQLKVIYHYYPGYHKKSHPVTV